MRGGVGCSLRAVEVLAGDRKLAPRSVGIGAVAYPQLQHLRPPPRCGPGRGSRGWLAPHGGTPFASVAPGTRSRVW